MAIRSLASARDPLVVVASTLCCLYAESMSWPNNTLPKTVLPCQMGHLSALGGSLSACSVGPTTCRVLSSHLESRGSDMGLTRASVPCRWHPPSQAPQLVPAQNPGLCLAILRV